MQWEARLQREAHTRPEEHRQPQGGEKGGLSPPKVGGRMDVCRHRRQDLPGEDLK